MHDASIQLPLGRWRRARPAILLAALTIGPWPADAQQGRGSISGTISDASGAAVPDAQITITNVGTQATFATKSNNEGFYAAPSLAVGAYIVAAAKESFKTAVAGPLTLQVDQAARVDLQLELGQMTDRVEVRAATPLVDTGSATVGKVVENRRISELPLNGRNTLALMLVAASVKSNAGPTQSGFSDRGIALSAVSINGGPGGMNQYLLDGATNNQSFLADINVNPAVDAVEEFKVQTSTMSAEFGFTAGGVVNIVTKSGTNEFKGSLYDFIRDDRFDAKNAFATIKPKFDYNQFGGSLGGPIWLPKLYKGTNRSFFFFNFEGWRFTREEPTTLTVPTAALRRGDFSDLRDASGNLIPIYDPATTRPNPAGPGFIRDQFPGNIIPTDQLDPVALNMLQFYPLPNRAPDNPFTNANNFRANVEANRSMRQTTAKIDHRLSSANTLSFRYTFYRHSADDSFGQSPLPDPIVRQRFDTLTTHNFVLSDTHVFGGALLNEARLSTAQQDFPFVVASFGGGWPQRLGLPASVPPDTFPRINNGLPPFNTGTAGERHSDTWQFFDVLTMVRGNHTLKLGADVRFQFASNFQRSDPSGVFNFPASLTGNPQRQAGTGSSVSTFLLGAVGSASVTTHLPDPQAAYSTSGFVQDDWKVSRTLTLNLGLRYDYQRPPRSEDCATSNFNPFAVNPETGLLGRLEFACSDYGPTFLEPDTNDWGPRVGFADNLFGNGRTVVRGGYGLFYATNFYRDYFGGTAGFATTSTSYQPPGGNTNLQAFRLQDGFPFPVVQPLGARLGPSGLLGQNVSYDERNGKNAESHQWTLSVQQQLPGDFVIEAGYSANRSTHLVSASYDLNQLDPQYFSLGLALQDQVPNPYAGRVPGPLGAPTITRAQSLRPYPYYNSISVRNPHQGFSTYHALLLSAEKRLSHGFVLLGSYTFGKLISDSILIPINFGPVEQVGEIGYQNGKFDRAAERSLDPTDVRHRLVVSGVYELPFGRGRRWVRDGGIVGAIVGGWQINSVTTLQGGIPLVVRGANNNRANRPNYQHSARVANPTVERWFDTDAFVNPPPFELGNVGRTLPDVRSPGVVNIDLSLIKQVPVWRRARLQLRAEAFNVANHVNLGFPDTTFVPGPDGRNVSSNFGRITSARDARILQFGARLVF